MPDGERGVDTKKILKIIFKGGLSVGLIVWILRGTGFGEIWSAVVQASFTVLIISFGLNFIGYFLSAARWRVLLRACGADTSLLFLVGSYSVAFFFNNLLPSTIGGDAYRAYDSCRLGQSKSNALSIIFVDRFLGLLVLMLFALFALMACRELISTIPYLSVWVALVTTGMIMFLWMIFFPPDWLPSLFANSKIPFSCQLNTVFQALFIFKGQPYVLLKALGISVLLQANAVIQNYLIAVALKLPVQFSVFFLIIPIATIITMLPISINGIGIRENVYVFLLSALAVMKPDALAFVWIAYAMVLLQGVIGGVVYTLRR